MEQVRYQIFISSTFRDLQEERQAVLDAVLNMKHFPAGMELFPASDSTPWEVIERVIDDSDYYILIVGGKYGSTDSNGISYTEREYDYAKHTNKPVLAFLHENPDKIPAGKVEMAPKAQKKLLNFRKKIQAHHCKYWKTAQELQYKVAISLIQEINIHPGIGWIRASGASNEELLARIDKLTRENERLRELSQSQPQVNLFSPRMFSEEKHSRPLKLFYSYAHKDEALRQELEKHLRILVRQDIIKSWSDRQITSGDDWKGIISKELESADIILLLISPDFLASDYCWDVEVKRAIERQEQGKAIVIPIILRPSGWLETPIARFQALPKDARPVTSWDNVDAAMLNIVEGITLVAKSWYAT